MTITTLSSIAPPCCITYTSSLLHHYINIGAVNVYNLASQFQSGIPVDLTNQTNDLANQINPLAPSNIPILPSSGASPSLNST
ncbi:hypothetical protein PVK06_011563 [Gossypium arboreum]|uniref:Uncharacterized protein n=1 Tax=Gossypium arboreum TaxID=29729 RepID=A0ABR0Q9N5_GOSAR|nr:hypothetical protein PVK06_011563 [Gossypium arboreum]